MVNIPRKVVEFSNDGSIPKEVAELPQDSYAPEVRPYYISFVKYNDKLCGIENLSGSKGSKALSILKKIGTKVYTRSDFYKNNLKTTPIKDTGEYKKLYNGLSADIELNEITTQSRGRIFYFDIESDRILYVVAITERHFEIDKNRR